MAEDRRITNALGRVQAQESDIRDVNEVIAAGADELSRRRTRLSIECHLAIIQVAAVMREGLERLRTLPLDAQQQAIDALILHTRTLVNTSTNGRLAMRDLMETLEAPADGILPQAIHGGLAADLGGGANLNQYVLAAIRGAAGGAGAAGAGPVAPAGGAGPVVAAPAAGAGPVVAAPAAGVDPMVVEDVEVDGVMVVRASVRPPPAGRGAPDRHVAGSNRLRDNQAGRGGARADGA